MRTEVTSKRTSRSKTFANDDGTFTLECGGVSRPWRHPMTLGGSL